MKIYELELTILEPEDGSRCVDKLYFSSRESAMEALYEEFTYEHKECVMGILTPRQTDSTGHFEPMDSEFVHIGQEFVRELEVKIKRAQARLEYLQKIKNAIDNQ